MSDQPNDTISFREIYESHSKMVYNLCLNYLQNANDAEDATQDIFVKIHQQQNQFKGKAQLKTWIYRISINYCIDYLRAKKSKKRFGFILSIFQPEFNSNTKALSNFNHPGVQLEDKEATARVFKYINTLPEKQKIALILKSIEGLSQKQVAEIMQISVKATESLLSRAKKNLKEKLKE